MKRYQRKKIHIKIVKIYGKAIRCELCNTKVTKKYEWSNKDHMYSFNRNDWWQLCVKCHRIYDAKKRKIKKAEWTNKVFYLSLKEMKRKGLIKEKKEIE